MQENIQPQLNSNQDDEISLKELILKLKQWWKYLLSKWVVIIIAGVIGGALGLVVSIIRKPIYIAELTFALEEDKAANGLGAAMGLASQFGIDLTGGGGGAFSGDNILELMKSRSMVERTLLSSIEINKKKITLVEYYINFNNLREKWEKDAALNNINFPINSNRSKYNRIQDSILNTITDKIRKKEILVEKSDKKINIISVSCQSTNEIFSKSLAEGLVREVTAFYITTKIGRSQKSVNSLQFKADSLHTELSRAMYGRAAAVDQTLNLNPAHQTASVPSQRKAIDIQILSTAYGEVVKNLEIAKLSLMRDTPFIQIIDVPRYPLDVKQISKVLGVFLGGFFLTVLTSIYLLIKYITK